MHGASLPPKKMANSFLQSWRFRSCPDHSTPAPLQCWIHGASEKPDGSELKTRLACNRRTATGQATRSPCLSAHGAEEITNEEEKDSSQTSGGSGGGFFDQLAQPRSTLWHCQGQPIPSMRPKIRAQEVPTLLSNHGLRCGRQEASQRAAPVHDCAGTFSWTVCAPSLHYW